MVRLACLVLTLLGAPEIPPVETIPGEGSYAVVVSRETFADPSWREVVDALVEKHDAAIVVQPGPVAEAWAALARLHPRYACFVARPGEAGRGFVIAVHRMTRRLDDDPYGDVRWGILTGYEAADALRIAKHREPLAVRRFAAGCGFDVSMFVEGIEFSEREPGVAWEKKPGGNRTRRSCPRDATESLVRTLTEFRPDYFMTSGHASTRDWQIGYRFRSGQFLCRDGQLYGLDLAGRRFDVRSPNPKIYTCSGNCLMGLVDGKQAMALAWMRSAGVHQMVGYVVTTWYGFGGRCERDLFLAQQGRFTLAESFFLHHQVLLHRLETRFPEKARVNLDEWGLGEKGPALLQRLARKHGLRSRDELGLLWDRDTVVLYGDPAWEARLVPQGNPAWDQTLTERDGRFRFEVTARKEGAWGTPPTAFLPYRVRDVALVAGAEHAPLVTDDFLLVPLTGEREPGAKVVVEFTAKRR
jgi:hypothetical protein